MYVEILGVGDGLSGTLARLQGVLMDGILVTGGAGFVGSNLAIGIKQAHPQSRVPALLLIRLRAAPVLGEEQGEPMLRPAKFLLGIQRPQRRVASHRDIAGEARLPAAVAPRQPRQLLLEPDRRLVHIGHLEVGRSHRPVARTGIRTHAVQQIALVVDNGDAAGGRAPGSLALAD